MGGIDLSSVRILDSVNNEVVRTMTDLVRVAMTAISSKQRFLCLGFLRNGREPGGSDVVEVLRADQVLDAEQEILVQHQIPAPVSPDLERVYRAHAPSHLPCVAGWLNCLRSLTCKSRKNNPV